MAISAVPERWITFNIVGAAGMVVQLGVLAILTRVAGMHVAAATLLAVEAAVLHNFVWHQRWTWRDRPVGSDRGLVERLVRFHAVNGVVSIAGNLVITVLLAHAGVDALVANLAAILACSIVNYAAGDAFVFRSAALLTLAVIPGPMGAEVHAQSASALGGWDGYVARVERRDADTSPAAFFALDLRKADRWRQRAMAGEVPMAEVEPPGIPDAKMHHWAGAVYVPRTTVEAVVKRLQDAAGNESKFYEEVKASKLLERNGDRVRVFMRLQRDASVVVVNYNTEHTVDYRRLGPSRAASRSVSTKIAEIADAGTPREREHPRGEDHGFLWRLNAYWRFEQAGDGVLIECESVSLSRNVPFIVRPLVGPIANRIARESLARTLRSLRKFLGS